METEAEAETNAPPGKDEYPRRARFEKEHRPRGIRVCSHTLEEIDDFEDCEVVMAGDMGSYQVNVHTSEGKLAAPPGHWIFEDSAGEHYPISHEEVKQAYVICDPAEERAQHEPLQWDLEALENGDGPSTAIAYVGGRELYYVYEKSQRKGEWMAVIVRRMEMDSEFLPGTFSSREDAQAICEAYHQSGAIDHGWDEAEPSLD